VAKPSVRAATRGHGAETVLPTRRAARRRAHPCMGPGMSRGSIAAALGGAGQRDSGTKGRNSLSLLDSCCPSGCPKATRSVPAGAGGGGPSKIGHGVLRFDEGDREQRRRRQMGATQAFSRAAAAAIEKQRRRCDGHRAILESARLMPYVRNVVKRKMRGYVKFIAPLLATMGRATYRAR